MNKVVLQLWEESSKKEGFLSDGCSLHIDSIERDRYVSEIYSNRDDSDIPNEYDRCLGEGVFVYIPDNIYNIVQDEKTLKLNESAFQNLIKFEEIIFNTVEI
jgi:hypothetical protein